jgi:hypothetical protein
MKLGRYQVWHLRPGAGALLLSACLSKSSQERAMDHWIAAMPDALLVYRTRRHDGTVDQELPLDRTLASLPKRRA